MKLYQEWHTGKGEGATLTILQLLAKADLEYKQFSQLGQWETKNKSSDLLGLQAKFDVLQLQFVALLSEHSKLQNKQSADSNKPKGEPKQEENEERSVNGKKWFYCTNCRTGYCWDKAHKTSQHKKGIGKTKTGGKVDEENKQQAHTASYDAGYGADSDFQLG